MLSTRLKLESETILDGIPDQARRSHAGAVLADSVVALQDHEARRPVAEALDQVVRLMERVSAHLDSANDPASGFAGVLASIDARTWIGIILGLAAATGAATGLDVADLLQELP
tara:strand:- start:1069 stop:1410 length:342 start_codon:yes stop_codon:yes gene_type:complete